jgi:hypothetical protein
MIDSTLVSISANRDPVSIEESSNATPLEKRSGNICANLLIDNVPKAVILNLGNAYPRGMQGVCRGYAEIKFMSNKHTKGTQKGLNVV